MSKIVIALVSAALAGVLGLMIGVLSYRTDLATHLQNYQSQIDDLNNSQIDMTPYIQQIQLQIDHLNNDINLPIDSLKLPLLGDESSIIETINHAPYWIKYQRKVFVGAVQFKREILETSALFIFREASIDGKGLSDVWIPVSCSIRKPDNLMDSDHSEKIINGWLPIRLELTVRKPQVSTAIFPDGSRPDGSGVMFRLSNYQLLKDDYSGWEDWHVPK